MIYQEAQRDYDMVRFATGEASSAALAEIASRVDTRSPAGSRPMLVFNPLAWERKDVVEFTVQMPENVKAGVAVTDAENQALPMQVISSDTATNTVHLLVEPRAVPSLGYEMLRVVPGKRDATTDLKAHGI